ncbi:uncharacterized protein LOC143220734 [Lasioglossum baleicum]|uniref:uncharacterized protein LOC143220734 n=1 Tax=Lasioglossum baleicum TaxID=434251 RepID=UPI003FCDED9A
MALYEAPVSAEELTAKKKNRAHMASVWRRGPAILAGLAPMDLRALAPLPRREIRPQSEELEEIEEKKREIGWAVMKRWQGRLRRPFSACHLAVGPIVPVLVDWMRSRCTRTFRITQVFYVHGCFGEYLHMIWKEVTPGCWHCRAEVDSVQHTMEECPAWAPYQTRKSGVDRQSSNTNAHANSRKPLPSEYLAALSRVDLRVVWNKLI